MSFNKPKGKKYAFSAILIMKKDIEEYILQLLSNEPENHLNFNVEPYVIDTDNRELLKSYLELEQLIGMSSDKFDRNKAFQKFKEKIK